MDATLIVVPIDGDSEMLRPALLWDADARTVYLSDKPCFHFQLHDKLNEMGIDCAWFHEGWLEGDGRVGTYYSWPPGNEEAVEQLLKTQRISKTTRHPWVIFNGNVYFGEAHEYHLDLLQKLELQEIFETDPDEAHYEKVEAVGSVWLDSKSSYLAVEVFMNQMEFSDDELRWEVEERWEKRRTAKCLLNLGPVLQEFIVDSPFVKVAQDDLPHYPDVVYGWKILNIHEDGRLYSPHQRTVWPSGQYLEANEVPDKEQGGFNVPGIHAVMDEKMGLLRDYVSNNSALVKIAMVGKIVEHDQGYRCQFAYPSEIYLTNLDKANLIRAKYPGVEVSLIEKSHGEAIGLVSAIYDVAWNELYRSRPQRIDALVEEAVKQGADLRGANLEGANLEGANLEGANLEGADLRWANLKEAYLQKANLEEADLRWANLKEANLEGANLRKANLEGADLWKANLWKANLQEAYLKGANLQRANLGWGHLWGANLEGANLWGASLKRANLEGAHLQGADLRGANLEGANLEGANLKGASLKGANLPIFTTGPHQTTGATVEDSEPANNFGFLREPHEKLYPCAWRKGESKTSALPFIPPPNAMPVGPFYHGTNQIFQPNDILIPAAERGQTPNYENAILYDPNWIYLSTADHLAERYAVSVAGRFGGDPHVYEVKPTRDLQSDPEQERGWSSDQYIAREGIIVREVPLPGLVRWQEGMLMRNTREGYRDGLSV